MPKISAAALREVKDAFRLYEEAVERSALKRTTKGTYLQHPERFIRWLEGKYTPPNEGSRR